MIRGDAKTIQYAHRVARTIVVFLSGIQQIGETTIDGMDEYLKNEYQKEVSRAYIGHVLRRMHKNGYLKRINRNPPVYIITEKGVNLLKEARFWLLRLYKYEQIRWELNSEGRQLMAKMRLHPGIKKDENMEAIINGD